MAQRRLPAYLNQPNTNKGAASKSTFVVYVRVSSSKQETEGESLNNQERAAKRHGTRTKHRCLAVYRDAASGKNETNRPAFQKMLADLGKLKPTYVLVDKLDRFTRNATDGLVRVQSLRAAGVGLLPLDWRRDTPINPDDERDWNDLYHELGGAQRERMRISIRIANAYREKYEQGRSVATRARFGVIFQRGGFFVADPKTAPIMAEADRRFVEGATLRAVYDFLRATHPDTWKSIQGLRSALRYGDQYVRAGVRSPETQAAILERLDTSSERFNAHSEFDHEFTGVFWCGRCAAAGVKYTMCGETTSYGREGGVGFRLTCKRGRTGGKPPHAKFSLAVEKFEKSWHAYLSELAENDFAERWARAGDAPRADLRRPLQRRLHEYDEREAAAKARRDNALHLYGQMKELGPTAIAQAKAALDDVAGDLAAIEAERQATLHELAQQQAPTARDVDALRERISQIRRLYSAANVRDRNRLNRELCRFIGSHPIVNRDAKGAAARWLDATVTWPEVDALRAARRRRRSMV